MLLFQKNAVKLYSSDATSDIDGLKRHQSRGLVAAAGSADVNACTALLSDDDVARPGLNAGLILAELVAELLGDGRKLVP